MPRKPAATLDSLLDEILDNARLGDWDRNADLGPQVASALAALTADLQSMPMTLSEVPVLRQLHHKILAASEISEERLTQIRPLIEAFRENALEPSAGNP